jgi:hypothetical protein
MKILFLLCLSGVLMFFDCSSNNRKISVNNAAIATGTNMQNVPEYKNKAGDVEYTFSLKVLKKGDHDGVNRQTDVIQITYQLKNTGDKNYLVYNRGHFGTNDSVVYVEPQKDGIVEISQKAFREPTGRNCPQRFVAVTPNASWLNAKQTVNNQIEVALPLKQITPFDDCTPQSGIPAKVDKARFCLGISEVDKSQVKISDNGFVQGLQYVKEQQLLCSDFIELK